MSGKNLYTRPNVSLSLMFKVYCFFCVFEVVFFWRSGLFPKQKLYKKPDDNTTILSLEFSGTLRPTQTADCNKNPPCFLASRSLRVHIRLLLLLLLLFHPLCTLPAHQPHARHLCIPSPQAPLVGTMAGAAADRYGVQWLVLLAALCQGISYFGASVTDQYLPLLLWCA